MEINENKRYAINTKRGRTNFFKKVVLIFILLSILFGGYYGSSFVRTKGYAGLWDFISTITSNYWQGRDANPESISIEIKDKDLKVLEKNRQQALERGLIINDLDGDYVPATIEYKGKKIKISMRLKGHMTDHIDTENKWSFRIKVKDKDTFMGMKRFSIQQPGTRGYIYEWIYHELMKREDIIALRYKFINVSVNGKDWGIYAVEENFENELIEHNKRVKGPVLRFNPDMYWVNRYASVNHENSYNEFASYYSANPEAYREDKVLQDSLQRAYYIKAVSLMEGLRNRRIKVAEAFDIQRLARFHAVIDLVGGVHSIDWSDIKYYYNPVTQRLEPVAYESFTELQSRALSSQYKYVELDSNQNYEDWHTMIFSDPLFFTEYVKNLERLSKKEYLDEFFNKANDELESNLAIIYKEYPYKKFDRIDYYKRQKMMLKILDPPQAIYAYFAGRADNKLKLQFGAMDALPVEIISVVIGNTVIKPNVQVVLPSKQKGEFMEFIDVAFNIPEKFVWADSLATSMKVNYSIFGCSVMKQQKVFPFPHTDNEFISEASTRKKGNINDFPFLAVDESAKTITIRQPSCIIEKDLVIPVGYKFMVAPGTSIDLKKGASITSYSPLFFEGLEAAPIVINSGDSSSQGIVLLGAGKSMFNYVTIKGSGVIDDHFWKRTGFITCYESPVSFSNSSFYNCRAEDEINLIRSEFSFNRCFFHGIKNDAIDLNFSKGEMNNCVFENCGKNAVEASMSKIRMETLYVNVAGDGALNLKAGSQLIGKNVRIKGAQIAVSVEDKSSVELQTIEITDCPIGIVAYQKKSGAGHPKVSLNKITFNNVPKNYLKEAKSSILVNGLELKEEQNDVEGILKNEKKK